MTCSASVVAAGQSACDEDGIVAFARDFQRKGIFRTSSISRGASDPDRIAGLVWVAEGLGPSEVVEKSASTRASARCRGR
jgi:hypothetical protein